MRASVLLPFQRFRRTAGTPGSGIGIYLNSPGYLQPTQASSHHRHRLQIRQTNMQRLIRLPVNNLLLQLRPFETELQTLVDVQLSITILVLGVNLTIVL